MGSAFGQMKSAVDPMQSFGKIMEVLNIVMLPLTYLMTIFASIIAKALIPYIGDIIVLMEDLEVGIEDTSNAMNVWANENIPETVEAMHWLSDAMDNMIIRYLEVLTNVEELNKEWLIFIDDLNIIYNWLEDLHDSFYNASNAIEDLIGWLEDIPTFGGGDGGGGGGGNNCDDPIYAITHPLECGGLRSSGNVSIPGSSSMSTSNSIIINMQGAIIDDRDKLIRDIIEQVIIRIG